MHVLSTRLECLVLYVAHLMLNLFSLNKTTVKSNLVLINIYSANSDHLNQGHLLVLSGQKILPMFSKCAA